MASQALGSSNGSSPNYTTTSPSNTGSLCGAESDSHDLASNAHTDGHSASSSCGADNNLLSTSLSTKCPSCHNTYVAPKVMTGCFHTFCQACLEKILPVNQTISCPECKQPTPLYDGGVGALPDDPAVSTVLQITEADRTEVGDKTLTNCTGCKSKDTYAVARCFDCNNFLCSNCETAHRLMLIFDGHRVRSLEDADSSSISNGPIPKVLYCNKHKTEPTKYFCKSCEVLICDLCDSDHKLHELEVAKDCCVQELEKLKRLVGMCKVKANLIRSFKKGIEHSSNRLNVDYQKARDEISETFNFYLAALEERRGEVVRELTSAYTTKSATLNGQVSSLQSTVDRLYLGCEFIERQERYASPVEVLSLKKNITSRMQDLLAFMPDSSASSNAGADLEFVSNFQAIQVGVKNTFGYIRSTGSDSLPGNHPQPIARPRPAATASRSLDALTLGNLGGSNTSLSSLNGFSFANVTSDTPTPSNPYDAWSTGLEAGSTTSNASSGHDSFLTLPVGLGCGSNQMSDLASPLVGANYPPKSQIKRQKMIYHCKFGEYGSNEGLFTEPSGVAVNAQNDIIVADTNNHRIQIFDREGRFKFQFGDQGKRDGQLMYPNRVAVVKQTGDIVVTERSPTHQVQIFNQYGQFVRKFGATVLQHPRGVTVDNMGRIVIVECKVMRVIIFDLFGNILQKFGCSRHLEFPNGVVVNDREEIFISDNRAHCVKVFNYQGHFMRQIGGEGISNYPIGVGINSAGEVLIADNHNNFNVTVFTQDGRVLSALESRVKHAQCFDVALLDDYSIILASKDYRLYIYRYAQVNHAPGYPYSNMPEPLTLDTFN